MRLEPSIRALVMAALLWAVTLGGVGCTQLRLPAIDPSGNRIFLPHAAAPGLGGHDHAHLGQLANKHREWWARHGDWLERHFAHVSQASQSLPLLPKPAFQAPPTPVPCGTGVAPRAAHGKHFGHLANHKKHLHEAPGEVGNLIVTPLRVVAPVGGEVVLTAGLCGPDRYFVMKQPLEWTISPDSVGQFVEAGDDTLHDWTHGKDLPDKRAPNYVLTRTSTREQLITRGSNSRADDVFVRQGQGWVSVTSATEGTSHVTIVAPEAKIWDRRRQTATIHWIDAQWLLPPPAVVRAGARQSQTLTTVVSRNSSGTPAEGWKVRYEIVSGPEAVFSNGQRQITVTTDAEGRATTTLQSASGDAGTNQIAVQIIRPPLSSGEIPLNIGEGVTTVTWSAPSLAMNVLGTREAKVGDTVSHQVDVRNNGNLIARGVVVSVPLPPNLDVLNSRPDAQVFGDRIEWPLGDMPGNSQKTILLNTRAASPGTVRMDFTAESEADGLRTRNDFTTEVTEPALQVILERVAPEGEGPVEVGQLVTYSVRITNNGSQTLRNVNVQDRFSAGLRERNGKPSPITRALPERDLAPGATSEFAVSFFVEQPGRLCHTLTVSSSDGQMTSREACLDAVQPQSARLPELEVNVECEPRRAKVGDSVLARITVKNVGDTIARGVQIESSFPVSLQPTAATGQSARDYRVLRNENRLVWTPIERLSPDETLIREIQFRCLAADVRAMVEARIQANGQTVPGGESELEIAGDSRSQPTPPARPPRDDRPEGEPVTGQLTLTIHDTVDPVRVGGKVNYLVVVKNDRDAADDNLVLTLTIPDGVRVTTIPRAGRFTADGRVELKVNHLFAREQLTFELQADAQRLGEQTVRARLSSRLTPEGIGDEETTQVIP